MDTKEFAIVKFTADNNSVGVIPTNWIHKNEKLCYYPDISSEAVSKLLKKRVSPTLEWAVHPIEILKAYGTYSEARRQLPKAVDTSNLESEEEVGRMRVRKHNSSADKDVSEEISSKKHKNLSYPSLDSFFDVEESPSLLEAVVSAPPPVVSTPPASKTLSSQAAGMSHAETSLISPKIQSLSNRNSEIVVSTPSPVMSTPTASWMHLSSQAAGTSQVETSLSPSILSSRLSKKNSAIVVSTPPPVVSTSPALWTLSSQAAGMSEVQTNADLISPSIQSSSLSMRNSEIVMSTLPPVVSSQAAGTSEVETSLSPSILSSRLPMRNSEIAKLTYTLGKLQSTVADQSAQIAILSQKIDNLTSAFSSQGSNSQDSATEFTALGKLPLDSMDDFSKHEENLKEHKYRDLLVKVLISLGGRDCRTHTYNILRRIMTCNLASHFSFTGKQPKDKDKERKRAFGSTLMCRSIQIAIKKVYPDTKDDTLKLNVSLWLQQAKHRLVRRDVSKENTILEDDGSFQE